jgi:hypothetical protein
MRDVLSNALKDFFKSNNEGKSVVLSAWFAKPKPMDRNNYNVFMSIQ